MRMLRPVGGVGGSGSREDSVAGDLGDVERFVELGRGPGIGEPVLPFSVSTKIRCSVKQIRWLPGPVRTSFSGVFPIKRAGEASGSEQEKLQPACLFPEASGSEGPPLVAGIHGSSPALVTRARRHDQWPRVFHGVKGCTGRSYARR